MLFGADIRSFGDKIQLNAKSVFPNSPFMNIIERKKGKTFASGISIHFETLIFVIIIFITNAFF